MMAWIQGLDLLARSHAWCETCLALVLQTSVVALAGLALAEAVKRRGPHAAGTVLRATVAGAAAVIVLAAIPRPLVAVRSPMTVGLPPGRIGAIWTPHVPQRVRVYGARGAAPLLQALSGSIAPRPAPPSSVTVTGVSAGALAYLGAAAVLAGGSLVSLLWLLAAYERLFRLRRRASPVAHSDLAVALDDACRSAGIGRPALLASADVRVPLLAGLVRPAILLPADVPNGLSVDALRLILRHEAAHAARRDLVWSLAMRIAGAVCWYNPLVWVLGRRLDTAAEEACDLDVLRAGFAPRAYADLLVNQTDRLVSSRAERAASMGVAPFRSALGRRVQQILAFAGGPAARLSRPARAGIVLAALAVAVTAAGGVAASRNPQGYAVSPGEALGSGTILGRVVDYRGEPMEGVEVSACRSPGNLPFCGPSLEYPGRTDERGRYRIDALPAGEYVLRVKPVTHLPDRAAGHLGLFDVASRGDDGVQVRAHRITHAPEIVMEAEASVDGTVIDRKTGRPLAGVNVAIVEGATARYPRRTGGPVADLTVTDSTGDFTFRCAPGPYRLFAAEPGVNIAADYVLPACGSPPSSLALSPGERKDVRLDADAAVVKGSTVEGRVLDERGRPASHVRVRTSVLRYLAAPPVVPLHGYATATTRADGTFDLRGLGPGMYTVSSGSLNEPGPYTGGPVVAAERDVRVASARPLRLPDLKLAPVPMVTGRVTYGRSGEPVQGAQIHCVTAGPHPGEVRGFAWTITDEHGRYAIPAWPGTAAIDAEAGWRFSREGGLIQQRHTSTSAQRTVVVPARGTTTANIAIERPGD